MHPLEGATFVMFTSKDEKKGKREKTRRSTLLLGGGVFIEISHVTKGFWFACE